MTPLAALSRRMKKWRASSKAGYDSLIEIACEMEYAIDALPAEGEMAKHGPTSADAITQTTWSAPAEAVKDEPPANVIADAVRASVLSPCLSKRGAVVFSGDTVLTSGYNNQVPPLTCSSDAACKATCQQTALHAEQSALVGVGVTAHDCDLLHVKTVDGRLVPSGPPSCVQCSKLSVAYGIAGVWLFHDTGWRRYHVNEFHELSVRAVASPVTGEGPAVGGRDVPAAPAVDPARLRAYQTGYDKALTPEEAAVVDPGERPQEALVELLRAYKRRCDNEDDPTAREWFWLDEIEDRIGRDAYRAVMESALRPSPAGREEQP